MKVLDGEGQIDLKSSYSSPTFASAFEHTVYTSAEITVLTKL